MRGPGRRFSVALVVGLFAALALLSVRARKRRALSQSAAVIARVEGRELLYRAAVGRAGDRLFASTLEQAVARLKREGVSVGRVIPGARSAVLGLPGVAEAPLARALDGLPLARAPIATEPGRLPEVEIRLTDDAARAAEDAALQQTAAAVRERAAAACPRCRANVIAADERQLSVTFPAVGELEEQTLKRALLTPPPPYPLELVWSRSR